LTEKITAGEQTMETPEKPQVAVEQKLADAAELLKEAAKQFGEVGLSLNFEIIIKAQRPFLTFGTTDTNDPVENGSPSK
jgi:hypothetical protein